MNLINFVKQALATKSSGSKLSAIFKELAAVGTKVSPNGPKTTMPKVPNVPKAPKGVKPPTIPAPKGSSIPSSIDPTDLRTGTLGPNGPASFGQSLFK